MAIALPRAETETGRKLEGPTGGEGWKHAASASLHNPLDSLPSRHPSTHIVEASTGEDVDAPCNACMKGSPPPPASKLNPTRDGTFNGRNFQKHKKPGPSVRSLGGRVLVPRRKREEIRKRSKESPGGVSLETTWLARVREVFLGTSSSSRSLSGRSWEDCPSGRLGPTKGPNYSSSVFQWHVPVLMSVCCRNTAAWRRKQANLGPKRRIWANLHRLSPGLFHSSTSMISDKVDTRRSAAIVSQAAEIGQLRQHRADRKSKKDKSGAN